MFLETFDHSWPRARPLVITIHHVTKIGKATFYLYTIGIPYIFSEVNHILALTSLLK